MKKKYLIITGGAGFIGSNLIEKFISKSKKINILSLDNYSSGFIKNHISSNRVKYIRGNTKNIKNIFDKYKNTIKAVIHLGEFSRISQSFEKMEECFDANINGTLEVIKFCLNNKIKIIYSATSAILGNKENPDRSPYAQTKFNNLNLLINLSKWKGLRYSVVYFYNVYGKNQIKNHFMSAVVGIFEKQYVDKKFLTVVKPGTQTRNFTHVNDTVDCILKAFKDTKNSHYAVFNKKFISILNLAKLFSNKIKLVEPRLGERFNSKIVSSYRGIMIEKYLSKNNIKDYILRFKSNI